MYIDVYVGLYVYTCVCVPVTKLEEGWVMTWQGYVIQTNYHVKKCAQGVSITDLHLDLRVCVCVCIVYVYIYGCMYVCMYVCVYVCWFVSVYVCRCVCVLCIDVYRCI